MRSIYLPQLAQAPQQTEVVALKETVAGLDTLTPVQGEIKVEHRGSYLQVSAQVETIVTLACDRCLQQYNHRLCVDVSEMMWLAAPTEPPVDASDEGDEWDDLVEVLSPQSYFDLEDWLYQQLCLQLPQRQLCDQTCPGLPATAKTTGATVDQRWAALEALKQALDASP